MKHDSRVIAWLKAALKYINYAHLTNEGPDSREVLFTAGRVSVQNKKVSQDLPTITVLPVQTPTHFFLLLKNKSLLCLLFYSPLCRV